MAMYDDTQWLLSHIQNSFATSDESGLSEIVLQGQWPNCSIPEVVEFPFLLSDDVIDGDEEDQPRSFDVQSEHSYMGHRFRSDTEHRLDKLKKEKSKQAKIAKVQWQDNIGNLTENEAEELFGAREVVGPASQKQPSLLSRMLECDDHTQNPYLPYAKWDASTDLNMSSKHLSIFVYTGTDVPNYPVQVVVNPAARVLDVIGLTCFLYTRDGNTPALTLPATSYSLHIADEDGTVDWCFTPLQHSSIIDHFGFKVLAIAKDTRASQQPHPQPVTVTVYISGGVFSLIECESKDVTLREVLNRTIAKRRDMARIVEAGVQYHLERSEDEPGRPLDLEKTLDDINSVTLHAVRDNSKRAACTDGLSTCIEFNTQYSYNVIWVKKFAKFDAILELSNTGIQLAVTGAGPLLRPPHPVSYSCDKLVSCTLKANTSSSTSSKKSNTPKPSPASEGKTSSTGTGGRCEVLLTCHGEQRFKDYLLECEESVGQELVEAVKRIKTEDSSKAKEEEKQPRRRYSFAGLKKRNSKQAYGNRQLPPN